MYHLCLSRDERKAFDWVGDRYNAGQIARLLQLECKTVNDVEWDSDEVAYFNIPEHVAWQIQELAEEEDYLFPCFADGLKEKLFQLCGEIV